VVACAPPPYEDVPVVPDDAIDALVAPAREAARARREAGLGLTLAGPLRRARDQETAIGNWFADQMRAVRPDVDLAVTNGGGLRADLPAGPLTYGALYELYPFDNLFARVKTTGAGLRRMLLRNLGSDGAIVSVSGVRVRARCEEDRPVVTVERPDGREIADDEPVTVLTSDFLASGGDGLVGLDDEVVIESGAPLRDVIAARLRGSGSTGELRPDDPDIYDPQRPRLAVEGARPLPCAAAARAGALSACGRRLLAVRKELRAQDAAFRGNARPQSAYAFGQPDPAARDALASLIGKLIATYRAEKPTIDLDCRTYACRLLVREPLGHKLQDWFEPLQRHPTWKKLTQGVGTLGPVPGRGADGRQYMEWTVFVRRAPTPEAGAIDVPADDEVCEAALGKGERELAEMKATIERDLPRHLRFWEGQENAALTAEVRRHVVEALGEGSGVTVDCRGQLCRLQPPAARPDDYSFREKVEADRRLMARVVGGSCCRGGRFLEILPDGHTHGGVFLRELVDDVEAASELSLCSRVSSERGTLVLRFRLPPTGEVNDDNQLDQVSVRYGGDLAGSRLHRCVERAMPRLLARHPVPRPVSGASLMRSLWFPR
jgi:5'-nucleotidase